MISKELFEKIKNKYGDVASWAVWEDAGLRPKSNMGHLNIFDLQKNPFLLDTLKNNVVMVGLNFSRPLSPTEPFKNFHDLNPNANDFKIRYAFRNTEFYGAYMTDIIKNFEMKDSNKVKFHLKSNQDLVHENISIFRKELSDIDAKKPIILAFGTATYNVLKKHLGKDEYSKLVRLAHYSQQIGQEDYKKAVFAQLNEAMNFSSNIVEVLTDAHSIVKKQVERIRKYYDNLSNLQSESSQELVVGNSVKNDETKALIDLQNIANEIIEITKKIKING